MTKKEKARMEELLTRAALYYTPDVEPDVLPPKSGSKLSVGYHFNSYNLDVRMGCSDSLHHSRRSTTKTDSQKPMALYSSALLAARAMRREIEKQCAKRLREADSVIERLEEEGDG